MPKDSSHLTEVFTACYILIVFTNFFSKSSLNHQSFCKCFTYSEPLVVVAGAVGGAGVVSVFGVAASGGFIAGFEAFCESLT